MLKQQTKLRVRLYARLSKDDGDADKESNSITNQLQMLRYNAKEKGFEVIGEYVDDGYSGTTFNRPDLNRMIKDAMDDPEPSGIMVKDMSRFGRNNAMFMYYVEEIFPNNDILFIALNDDVDTRFDENEMMPFKSIMNEYYARDTSKKIRSVKKTTALSGGFCGSFAPYGYVVDPENKRKLLVDSDTAPIVKRIFELSKQGNSVHQIARTLCEDGVLIPRAYRAMKNGTLETSTGFKFPTDWVAKNVKMILENQVYLGHMVSHKTQTKSFKNKKPVAVPKEEWIIVRNTHEAIIDEETFELVQKFISVKKQPNKTGRPNIFVGLVKCPDCGRNMAFSNPNGREPRFRCRTYVRNSNLCTTHAISYEALQQIVMSDIQKHIKNMEALGDQFIQEMHELSEKGGSKKIKQFEKDLEVAEKRIAEIDSVIMKLFEQNALGKISDERFEKMSSAYESEQKELAQKRDELRTKIRAEEKKTQSTNQFLETIRKYETVTELNRSMLVELIDSIYVYQAEGTGKDRKQRWKLTIVFLRGLNVVSPDGNGRMSRLLTLLILYKSEYYVGQYISIERLISDTKENYYEALQESSWEWHEGRNDYAPFVKYMLGVIVAAYREFADRVEILTDKTISKSDRIEDIIRNSYGRITKAEIAAQCPEISQTTIQRTLNELLKNNQIIKIGGGRYTSYVWNRENE